MLDLTRKDLSSGYIDTYIKNIQEKITIRRIFVKARTKALLQYHNNISKIIIPIYGMADIVVDGKMYKNVMEYQNLEIFASKKYRIIPKTNFTFIEICIGEFDENDVIIVPD